MEKSSAWPDPCPRAAALVAGTLAVGILDILDAFIFFGLRGARPIGILQSIASGVLGRAAYQGGMRTAALGLLLHFVIAFGVVATYLVGDPPHPGAQPAPLAVRNARTAWWSTR